MPTVLIVDDDPKLLKMLQRTLHYESQSLNVFTATNGLEALQLVQVHNPDLIISDWMMPKMDGLAFVRRLRDEGYKTMILMLTARDAVDDRVDGLESGADDYLVKPFAPAELVARVHAMLRRVEAKRENQTVSYADLSLDPLTWEARRGDLEGIAPASAAAETITMPVHTATHIDALCHIGEHQDALGNPQPGGEVRLYAGKGKTVAAKDTVSYQGQLHLSAGDMIPIIQHGILVDVAGYKEVDVLPDAYEITVEDLQATLDWENVKIAPETAVIFRTGYYKHFREGNPAYLDAIAGPGLPVAQCLIEAGVTLVGADNMTVEALPPLDHRVHRFLLVHNGVTLVENMFLEMLAAEKAYEFLLMIAPLRIYGATGSWVNPIAIT